MRQRLAVLLCLSWAATAQAQLQIHELEYDQPNADTGEFIELTNGGSEPITLSDFVLEFVNGGATPPAVYRTISLPAATLAPGALFVVCADAANVPNCELDLAPDRDLIQNGPDAIAVRRAGTTDLELASYEGEVAGFGGSIGSDLGSGATGLSRCSAGEFRVTANTPGAANVCAGGESPPGNCGDPADAISGIQGTGASSPREGGSVSIEGVVTGDFQTTSLNGFFVQEEPSDEDGDPRSSEGIFVYQGASTVAVAPGDRVRVSGTVLEYEGLTEISGVSNVQVCGEGPALAPTSLALPVTDPTDFERYEGVWVEMAQTLTVTGNYELGRYGSLDLSVGGRLYQPTQVATKGAPALEVQRANALRRIVLDDGESLQNPNPIPFKSAANTRRVGDTLASLTGVLDQRFGGYRIQPTVAPSFSDSNPREPAPRRVGRLRIASMNVLNYFTTLDDGEPHCGPHGDLDCRGANTAEELARQHAKLLQALRGLNADVIGLLEVENDDASAVREIVGGLNALAGARRWAYVDTGAIGADAIKVALIYRPAKVRPVGRFALLTRAVEPSFADDKHRPVLAQTFRELRSGERLTVAINHWKSKGSDCEDIGDPDLGDGQGNCNRTRVAAAHAVANWLASDPTGSRDPDRLILGDLNSYAKEDPILALEAAGYQSLVAEYSGDAAYSYQFEGQSGYLDYALATASLAPQVAHVSEWHSNADEPTALDYNLEYKTDDPFSPADPYRAADHDPLLVDLDLGSER